MNEGPEATADDLSQIRNLVRALFEKIEKNFGHNSSFNTRGRVLFLIFITTSIFST